MARCGKCGNDVPEEGKFCNHCGAPIPKEAERSVAKCNACGAENAAESKFCASCGAQLQRGVVAAPPPQTAPMVRCPQCGMETIAANRFCGNCGASLQASPQARPQPSPVTVPATADFSGLSSYYQEEFKKIRDSNEAFKGKWNWASFFFNILWGFTKGLWLAPLVSLAIVFVLNLILGMMGLPVGLLFLLQMLICLVVMVSFGRRGTFVYYNKHVKGKQILATWQ